MGLNEQGIMQTVCKHGRASGTGEHSKAQSPNVTFSHGRLPFQIPKWHGESAGHAHISAAWDGVCETVGIPK